MIKYLLLRDNKESGPYTLEELKTKGLKAYDLVWIEGKSAAWRYPCEIQELSSFAPAVEEQPFDRFFKKPVQTTTAVATTIPVTPLPEENIPAELTPAELTVEPVAAAIREKRIIYVTLPAGKGTAVMHESPAPTPVQQPEHPVASREKAIPAADNAYLPQEPSRSFVSKTISTPLPLDEENFSHPMEDWRSAAEIKPRLRKSRLSRVLQPVSLSLCIVALLAAGIFIGLSINKNDLPFVQKLAYKTNPDNTSKQSAPAQTTSPLPVNAAATTPASQEPGTSVVSANSPVTDNTRTEKVTAADPAVSRPAQTSVVKTTIPSTSRTNKAGNLPGGKSQSASNQTSSLSAAPIKDSAVASLSPVPHRDASHRTENNATTDKDAIRSNISNLVSVGTNNYTVGTFGGISELQVTVSNRSVYPLDLVVVAVDYIQANKKIFKTENLYFRAIGSGAALMLEAPKSNRGIKVQYRITLINSKELGLSYSAI